MSYTPDDIKTLVDNNKILLFCKGSKDQPACGYSAKAIEIFKHLAVEFEVVDIFSDPTIRPALVEFSGWPTTPQIFVNQELLGGSDITLKLFESGELKTKIEATSAA